MPETPSETSRRAAELNPVNPQNSETQDAFSFKPLGLTHQGTIAKNMMIFGKNKLLTIVPYSQYCVDNVASLKIGHDFTEPNLGPLACAVKPIY